MDETGATRKEVEVKTHFVRLSGIYINPRYVVIVEPCHPSTATHKSSITLTTGRVIACELDAEQAQAKLDSIDK